MGRIAYELCHRYAACSDVVADKVVAVIGCGDGHGAALLAKRARHVIGLDGSAETVRHAHHHYRHRSNLSFVTSNCPSLPLANGSIDVVISLGVVESIVDLDGLVADFARVMMPNGSVIAAASSMDVAFNDRGQPDTPQRRDEEFLKLCRRHFDYVEMYRQDLAISSFILTEQQPGASMLKGYLLGDRGTDPGSRPLRGSVCAIAVCANSAEALPAIGSSIRLDPANDLFKEEERARRWAAAPEREPARPQGIRRHRRFEDLQQQYEHLYQTYHEALAAAAKQLEMNRERERGLARAVKTLGSARTRSDQLEAELRWLKRDRGLGRTLRAAVRAARRSSLAMSFAGWIGRSGGLDIGWYVRSSPQVRSSIFQALRDPSLARRAGKIGRSGLFDLGSYLRSNPAVEAADVDPMMHYLRVGWREGRDPNQLFCVDWYLRENPDVSHAGAEPLLHYIECGGLEGRNPHPLFNGAWYLERYPDVAQARANPLAHYLFHGAAEGRDPHPLFDTKRYMEKNPDVLAAGLNPLIHYLQQGGDEPLPGLEVQAPARRPAADAVKGARDPAISAALQQVMRVFYDNTTARAFWEAYDLLRSYRDLDILDTDLPSLPDVTQLTEEIAQFSRQMPRDRIDVSIVIPVHNKIIYTLCCLKALLGLPARTHFEIIVADDSSTDATATLIGSIGGIVHHRRNSSNVGFTLNCNLAARIARGEIIVFLNNDTIPLPHWLDELVETIHSDPSIGLVGSKLLAADGALQEAGGIVWQDGSAWNFGREGDATAPEFNYVKDVDYLSGASIATPRWVWEDLGGFDELYAPAYCEDTDFAFRVRAHGLRVVYQPFSAVVHHEGVSHGRDVSSGIKAYQSRNNRSFFSRWKDVLAQENLPSATDIPLARDRSRGRPRILVLDHYVPQPDRDAGSRTMEHYLKLFRESGFHVSFWPQNRYYDRTYAQALQRLGIEVLYDLNYKDTFDEWLAVHGRYLDYVFVSRASVAIDYIGRLRAQTKAKVLFYGHDIHFRRLAAEFTVTGNPSSDAERAANEKMEREVWSQCDVIYYLSEEERNFVSSEFPSKAVRVMPAFIYGDDRLRRTQARLRAFTPAPTPQLLFVGGFRHRPNVDAMLWFVKDVWPSIVSAVPEARLYIAGSFPPPEIHALAGRNILVTGMISDEMLYDLYLSSRVAIVPLRFGAGVKGKLLEALSYGVPIVTTSVGMQGMRNASVLADVCDNAADFGAAVVSVLKNPASRIEKAMAGLEFVASTASATAARRVIGLDVPEMREPELAGNVTALPGVASR